MMKIEALIFDLDGTLIDSTGAYAAAARQAFNDFHLSYTSDEFQRLATGVPLKVWLQEKGVSVDTAILIAEQRDSLVLESLRAKTEWRDGAKDALEKLGKIFPLAIVTGAWTKSITAIDERLGLRKLVPIIIDGDQVKPRFKPDPYGLLLAAEQLQVKCENSAYIGDQLYDMLAARNAGMSSFLIPGLHTKVENALLAATDQQWPNWKEFVKTMNP